jgi:hypothetical protein
MSLHQRHLDESQRAMVAAKIATLKLGANQHTATAAASQGQAAKLLNVSPDSIQRARKIREKGVPELVEAVKDGRLAVSAAATLAKLPEHEQRAILAQAEQAGGRTGRRKLQLGRQLPMPTRVKPPPVRTGSPDAPDRPPWRTVREALDRVAGCPVPVERLAADIPLHRVASMARNARAAITLLAVLADRLDERAALAALKRTMPEVGG